MASVKRKVIIDVDPGIGDSFAIIMALQSEEVEVVGITTTFGSTSTANSVINTLYLCKLAGKEGIPVTEGEHSPLNGSEARTAEFAHGKDGLGNLNLNLNAELGLQPTEPTGSVDFLIESVESQPNEISIICLGALTNIAKAIQKNKNFIKNIKDIWVCGGSFLASGNVNPSAEANIFADPEAADMVLTSGAKIFVMGLNVSTLFILTEKDIQEIEESNKKFGKFISKSSKFYLNWYLKSDHLHGIYLHSPACIAMFLHPNLFHFRKTSVRVETKGVCRGLTIMDLNLKNWNSKNLWMEFPPIDVAMSADSKAVVLVVKELLKK